MILRSALLFWTLVLFACSPDILTPQLLPDEQSQKTGLPSTLESQDSTGPKIIVTVGTPNIGQPADENFPTPSTSQEGCGFTWAYNDMPELSSEFHAFVKSLIPDSNSHATAFGENCIAADGQIIRFLAIETDFYVSVTVTDLDDYETFGNWIAQVMQGVNTIHPDMIAGPKPGFVEFRLEKNISESIGFRVPIQQYNETANGKKGKELFRLFYTNP